MHTIETALDGVRIIEPRVFGDERGFFMETWNQARYAEVGLPAVDTGTLAQDLHVFAMSLLRLLSGPQAALTRAVMGAAATDAELAEIDRYATESGIDLWAESSAG